MRDDCRAEIRQSFCLMRIIGVIVGCLLGITVIVCIFREICMQGECDEKDHDCTWMIWWCYNNGSDRGGCANILKRSAMTDSLNIYTCYMANFS